MGFPKAILDIAQPLVETYGFNFEPLGRYETKEAYRFVFPSDVRTGFPYIYLFDAQSNGVQIITGREALSVLKKIKNNC